MRCNGVVFLGVYGFFYGIVDVLWGLVCNGCIGLFSWYSDGGGRSQCCGNVQQIHGCCDDF